jgi:hypothetical protein
MSNQGSDFQWCKCGVYAHLPIRKSVEALGKFRFLCTPAVADEKHFDHPCLILACGFWDDYSIPGRILSPGNFKKSRGNKQP